MDYLALLEAETGRETDPVKWLERQGRRALIDRQSAEIADRLRRVGIDLYAPPAAEPITLLGELTGAAETSTATRFRHSLFVPSVAKRDRASHQRRLEAFLQDHPRARFARYMVVTAGQRIPWRAPDLRERVQAFHRRLGEWVREVAQRFGVEVLVRVSEMTMREMPGLPGTDGVHLHANVVYIPQKLNKTQWSSFLSFSHTFFDARVHDAGRIKDLSEIVKYITKPGVTVKDRSETPGLLGMVDLDSARLAWLHEGLAGLHLFQPVGGFRRWCAELTASRQKLYRVQGGRFVRVDMPAAMRPNGGGGSRENILVARTLPQARFAPVHEPVSLVLNFTANPSTREGYERLWELMLRQQDAASWAAARAVRMSPYSVHTSTVTPGAGSVPAPASRSASAAAVGPPAPVMAGAG